MNRLLFVCHANVCRSPVMAATAMGLLESSGIKTGWRIDSGGVSPAVRSVLCPIGAEIIDEVLSVPLASEFRARFSPRAPRQKSLEEAGLILTATTDERARLAQQDPALRKRAFTMLEAVSLGRRPLSEDELVFAQEDGFSLHAYSSILHERRGMVEIEPLRRGLRRPNSSSDLVDVHMMNPRLHRSGLVDVHRATREFFYQMSDYLGAGG